MPTNPNVCIVVINGPDTAVCIPYNKFSNPSDPNASLPAGYSSVTAPHTSGKKASASAKTQNIVQEQAPAVVSYDSTFTQGQSVSAPSQKYSKSKLKATSVPATLDTSKCT